MQFHAIGHSLVERNIKSKSKLTSVLIPFLKGLVFLDFFFLLSHSVSLLLFLLSFLPFFLSFSPSLSLFLFPFLSFFPFPFFYFLFSLSFSFLFLKICFLPLENPENHSGNLLPLHSVPHHGEEIEWGIGVAIVGNILVHQDFICCFIVI